MKRILTLLLLCSMWSAVAQPVIRQSFTTNSSGKTPNILATTTNTIYPLMVLNPDGSGGDRSILFSEYLTLTGTNTTLGGNLSLNGRTNKLSIASDMLFLDGVAVGGGGDTIWTNDNGTISAQSTVADEASAVAFSLKSSNTLSASRTKLAAFSNNGTNKSFIASGGGIGFRSADDDGDVGVKDTHSIYSLNIVANGDPDINQIILEVREDAAFSSVGFGEWKIERNNETNIVNQLIVESYNTERDYQWTMMTGTGTDSSLIYRSNSVTLFRVDEAGSVFTSGYASLSGETNQLTIAGNQLLLDNVAIGGGLATSASQYIIVGGAASGAANWTALSNAYVASAAATPNGAALAAGNRYTVFLLPGVYDQGASSLVMTNNYVDLVGMSENTGIRVYNGTPNDADIVIKTSGTIGISLGAIDAWLINLCLEGTASTSRPYSPTSGTATHRLKNVYIVNSTANAIPNEYQGMPQTVYGGYYEDVRCWNAGSFSGEASGTFIRCKAGAYGFGHSGFGGSGIASGTFIDCEASFGFGSATASGMFLRCRTLPTSGTPNNQGFGTGAGATFSGMAIDCFSYAAGNAFAGNAGTMSGTLIGCGGGNPASSELALTGWSSVTGKVLGCNFVGYNFGTLNVADLTTSTNGFASFSTTTPVNIAATGWTNTFAKNATVFADGTTMTITVKNNAGTSVYTNTLAHTGVISIPLQVGGAVIISGTGVAGRAVPF